MSRFYQSKATVWPFEGRNDRTGVVTYGTPIVIDCTHKSKSEIRKDTSGREYVTSGMFFTEDNRPNRSDFIALGESTEAAPIPTAFEVISVNRFDKAWRGRPPKFEVVV